ncbi:hypothetical protein H5410_027330, partial [Solanum commersonii]
MGPTFGTTNLNHHLEKHNPDKAKEGQNEPIDQKTYREKMSLAICRHNYAFSFVEHKGIRDIHSILLKFCFSKFNSDTADQKVKVIEDNL